MSIAPPALSFFCELETQPLHDLFARPEVVEFLQDSQATLCLGILDLSEARARVVQDLNAAGVSVTAWLLLPRDQGYWLNLDNASQAAERYAQFSAWSREYGLHWSRIGLDIEPDFQTMKLMTTNRLAAVQRLFRQYADRQRLARGKQAYHALVEQMHTDGYTVETYQIPLIIDERMAHSKLVQRFAGLVDLPEADREILMLYSSFTRPWGQGILWSYGPFAQGIGLGITGQGMEQEAALEVRPMNWAELETDLLLARQHCHNLYIFSLEGCVQQNFLPLLRKLAWEKPVQVPYAAARQSEDIRGLFRRLLWLLERPAMILFGLAMLVSGVVFVWRKRR